MVPSRPASCQACTGSSKELNGTPARRREACTRRLTVDLPAPTPPSMTTMTPLLPSKRPGCGSGKHRGERGCRTADEAAQKSGPTHAGQAHTGRTCTADKEQHEAVRQTGKGAPWPTWKPIGRGGATGAVALGPERQERVSTGMTGQPRGNGKRVRKAMIEKSRDSRESTGTSEKYPPTALLLPGQESGKQVPRCGPSGLHPHTKKQMKHRKGRGTNGGGDVVGVGWKWQM